MKGIWNLIADISESGFSPEIQERVQSSGPLESHKEGDETSVCSRTEYARRGEERERMVKSNEEETRKGGEMGVRRCVFRKQKTKKF